MRTLCSILTLMAVVIYSSETFSQSKNVRTACSDDRLIVRHIQENEPPVSIKLSCDAKRGIYRGQGIFQISGVQTPVIVSGEVRTRRLIIRIKTAHGAWGFWGQNSFYMTTGPSVKHTKDFTVYRTPEWGAMEYHGDSRKPLSVAPLVLRSGERIPGKIRVTFEKKADSGASSP